MPPIPVHIDDPITPQKATGTTPQTAQGEQWQASAQAATTATTTQPSYPPARPGQAAVPAPTPYIPPQPTRTTQVAQNGPPLPQPGAVPIPPTQQTASPLPPPPKPGEAAKAREASTTQPPPQMGIPAPVTNYAPTHSTSTIPPPPGPRTLNLGPVTANAAPSPAARPEGYVQNAHAQEMSAAQRSSLEEQERRESVFSGVGLGGNAGGSAEGGVGETAASAWTAVKGFMGTAGEKLAGAEEEVWRRLNGGK
jgi:hypothetical protein